MRGDEARISISHGYEMNTKGTGVGLMTDDELERGVACSVIFQSVGEVPALVCDGDQRYSAISSFIKATVYSSLARTSYTGQMMQDYIAN